MACCCIAWFFCHSPIILMQSETTLTLLRASNDTDLQEVVRKLETSSDLIVAGTVKEKYQVRKIHKQIKLIIDILAWYRKCLEPQRSHLRGVCKLEDLRTKITEN
ncbi:hypothetical protein AUEXF2481DRAFT_30677 [Aureobasidium subglaciale EXF-2481]|uniref:Uncharacterized protein n=1 Tax=Aureobasidium subglaciale (strain EXF-2481) TaxID=1043005 RepID=A0A074YJ89_AURSE|nr:uncharacterized protein AUEXF2481DRAFT_30677 [Aureobasidium subglaciale EXF-2481]KEQ94132.1 hypothetical protein AUEXF2481DRAFT_30677 [Aureobasidium subglaciale EXF-2481]